MTTLRPYTRFFAFALCMALASCGARQSGDSIQTGPQPQSGGVQSADDQIGERGPEYNLNSNDPGLSIWEVFGPNRTEQTVNVNRYIWAASLDVLNFLPVQTVDPFTGVIVTGYGTPPGGGRSYRATIHVRDPALDARSLNVSLQSRGGAVNAATIRAVEDAILSRARQLRIRDRRL